MSGVTVVVEAGHRSGSLNTATHARELDRPIGVIPGPITSGASAGCHRLLRSNPAATLVTTVADIVELFGEIAPGNDDGAFESDASKRVIDSLSNSSPRTIERIAAMSGMDRSAVTSTLGELEALGRVRREADGWCRGASK